MHENDRRVGRNLGDPEPHRVGTRRPAGHAGADLAAAELLGKQDCGLLPAGRSGDDDRVDPVGGIEAREAFRQQRLFSQANERLGPVGA